MKAAIHVRQSTGQALRKGLGRLGYDLVKRPQDDLPFDLKKEHKGIIQAVRPFTATTPERIAALVDAVDYIATNQIPGALVECGVWRGGSMMAAALKLLAKGVTDRDLWLFDTFSGMTPPSDLDRRAWDGRTAEDMLEERSPEEVGNIWCVASVEDVQANLASTGYPTDRCRFVVGPVEDTIPGDAPQDIALLRLDTDWYESTAHELRHLYQRIAPGGVLILDDYGEWEGARRATDEFMALISPRPLLVRLDSGGRLAVVPGGG